MYLLLSQSFFDGIGANTSLQKEEEKMIERLKERLKGWLKEQLSDGFKIARLVLTGIIGGWLILAVCMYVYKAGEEPKIPEGVFVNEQNISFNDLNIGKEILLCEGSDYYCRQVFNRYTELVSKEFGEPGATLRGESGNPMDRGEHNKRLDTRQRLRDYSFFQALKRVVEEYGRKAKDDYLDVKILIGRS